MDSARGSADGCLPDAGTSGFAVGVFSCNTLLCAAEVADFLALACLVPTVVGFLSAGDFDEEDFGEVSDAWVEAAEEFAGEDFGEESEGSADCDGELAVPVAGVSA